MGNLFFRNSLCSLLLIFLLATTFTSIKEADGARYFDKNGTEITAEEYRSLTGQAAPVPSVKDASPEAQPQTQDSPETITAQQPSSPTAPEYEDQEDADTIRSLQMTSETILRIFERDTAEKSNLLVVPIYQYLALDYGSSQVEGFSAHFQGWGRYDAGDGNFFEENPDGALLHAYLQYADPEKGYNLKLGRHQIFKGNTNESIDGFWGETFLSPYFTVSAYGGLPVGLEDVKGRDSDLIYGGRVSNLLGGRYEIGGSYKWIKNAGATVEESLGIDLFAVLTGNTRFSGYSTYNAVTKGWAEHSYELRISVGEAYFRPFYERFSYSDYFIDDQLSSNIFGFLRDTGEIMSVIGTDLDWRSLGPLNLGAAIKYYDYDIRPDNALYTAATVTAYIVATTEVGGEIGYMNGNTPETRYLLSRAYYYWEQPFDWLENGFLSGDVVYVLYDEKIFGKDRSIFVSLGGGFNLYKDALQLKISGDYSDDPYFDTDIRGQLVLLFIY